ncbi:MAG: biopolymer transporter ExbD [Phycisphaerae bacterium]|nr:biopolymer transporter ExbD [Phycisphaerae bacterium]
MRFKTKRDKERAPTLNMASMIDATFLLLAYFIFTTGVTARESQLSPNITAEKTSAGARAGDFEPQVIEVLKRSDGPVYKLGERYFTSRPALTEALRSLEKSAGLFVRVSPGPTVGFATAAVQAGRDAGFDQVTYVPAK